MRSEARLDAVVFQLTPTRTRCNLVIVASDKKEKIASGLLNPFLAHLKAAQDQITKGGYSITLEPDANNDASWFTKGIVERFVRFVSTPEIVERVSMIESEILQIENAITIQNNEKVDSDLPKLAEGGEGKKASVDDDAEKAIVLYKPDSQPNAPDSNGSTTIKENSKVQLLRVLETRKVVLQKEQAMAFARAAAAGFDMDDMSSLISFAESFGALRLKEACMHYMDLWKKKHETGEWIEVEAIPEQSGFPYLNGSGIMLAADSVKQKELGETWHASDDMGTENGNGEKVVPSDEKVPIGPQEHVPGQLLQPMYSQWPIYPPPSGSPAFQPYPMPGMPYYNYHGGVPYFHPLYPPPADDQKSSAPPRHKKGSKQHSVENKDSSNESETWEQITGSQDDSDKDSLYLEKESSHDRHSHKKGGQRRKKKHGVVVIRNLNYIAKKFGATKSESPSGSDAETEEETENFHSSIQEIKQKQSSKTLRNAEVKKGSFESSDTYNKREETYEPQTDSQTWEAFQSFLFKVKEKSNDNEMFWGENATPIKGKQGNNEVDPLIPTNHVYENEQVQRIVDFDSANGITSRIKQAASNDDVQVSESGVSTDNQFKEIQGDGSYRKMASDEFLIYSGDKKLNSRNSLDPLTDHVYENTTKVENGTALSPYNGTDESFMLPYRPTSPDYLEQDSRVVIDMDSEFPSAPIEEVLDLPKTDNVGYNYEPDDFYLVPDREVESVSVSYDPAFEYDFQVPVQNVSTTEAINTEELSMNIEEETNKLEKDKKPLNSLEKRRKDTLVKRGTLPRMNPSVEAQKRAEKLRTYKADLQKMKKEQEEEKLKRLEALKLERQKRIAARSGSNQSPAAQQNKTRLSTKLSPSPQKGSKLNDPEPGFKFPSKTNLRGPNDSKTKSNKLNGTLNGLA